MKTSRARSKNWLNDHRLTLNVLKTKFMIIEGTQRLNRLGSLQSYLLKKIPSKGFNNLNT